MQANSKLSFEIHVPFVTGYVDRDSVCWTMVLGPSVAIVSSHAYGIESVEIDGTYVKTHVIVNIVFSALVYFNKPHLQDRME